MSVAAADAQRSEGKLITAALEAVCAYGVSTFMTSQDVISKKLYICVCMGTLSMGMLLCWSHDASICHLSSWVNYAIEPYGRLMYL